jgi:uncharacterized membrane protein YdjX (TVP38/TMEM64 family)
MAEVKDGGGLIWLKLGALLAIMFGGALVAAFTPLGQYLSRDGVGQAIEWLRGSSAAPLVYIALYATATALAIPGSILTLAGGAMFGVVWGTLYTTIGANIGANLAFGVARFLGRDAIERVAGDRLAALDRATANHGFKGLLTLRLIPAVPFNALNFGSGLTGIRWPTYALATVIGIFPGTLVYTMFADALLAGSVEASRDALIRVLISGALLVLLSFLPTIAKRLGVKVPGGTATTGVTVLLFAGALHSGVMSQRLAAQSLPDHQAFTAVLADVVQQPLIDYQKLKDNRVGLDAYLRSLAAVDPALLDGASEDRVLAFWINTYNACMLRLVVDHYPIQKAGGILARIKNVVADRPANSVWQISDVFSRKHCAIAGAERSQDEIEHELIRPMGDPRIHFAVNCAALSCPPLWPEAYDGGNLDAQLDRAVANLLGNTQHMAVEGESVRLNKVLDWYNEDFGGHGGLKTFMVPYVAGDVAAVLSDPRTKLDFFDYDWTLNDIRR